MIIGEVMQHLISQVTSEAAPLITGGSTILALVLFLHKDVVKKIEKGKAEQEKYVDLKLEPLDAKLESMQNLLQAIHNKILK